MAAWRSVPGGDRDLGLRDWSAAITLVWFGPFLLGIGLASLSLLLTLALGAGADLSRGLDPLAALFAAGWVLLVSPLVAWVGILPALPATWALLRLGYGGWAGFALLGAAAGGPAGALVTGGSGGVGALWGAAAGVAAHRLLAFLRPQIFTPR